MTITLPEPAATAAPLQPRFPHHWCHSVEWGGAGSTSASRPTLAEALADGFKNCAYYLMMYPAVTLTVHARCDHCNGTGEVVRRRTRTGDRWKPCPACKGKPEGPALTFPARLPGRNNVPPAVAAALPWLADD